MRTRSFSDVALEGLVVVSGGMIVDANSAFWKLSGMSGSDMRHLKNYLPELGADEMLRSLLKTEAPREMLLCRKNGERIPVEVYARENSWRGKTRTILAIIDLRARKAAEAEIKQLSVTDPLTGLGNRSSFVTALKTMLRSRNEQDDISILLIDIDRFKDINDTYGHDAGDKVLGIIADSLHQSTPPKSVLARMAGDEFAIACVGKQHSAHEISQKIQNVLRKFPNSENEFPISVSIGFTLVDQKTADADSILHCAGIALLAAKQSGRGNIKEYDSAFDRLIKERLKLEREIQIGLERNEFFLEYQPIMSTKTRALSGYEALIRWQHPERGRIPPDKFIGIAEEAGLIAQLGEWVLRQACRDATKWQNHLTVAINVSPLQFTASDLPELIHKTLVETGLLPTRLNIEITESTLLNGNHNISILSRLREMGVGIVMDDFGTGYSSLSYLRDFQFDKVKIDRSFILDMLQKPHAAAIVDAILSLGNGLGIDIVAEGIETVEQLCYLENKNCAMVQGYFIGRPSKTIAKSPSDAALNYT